MSGTAVKDVINQLAGIAGESPVAALREQKPDLVAWAQNCYNALLEPAEPGSVSLSERHAAAYRTGILMKDAALADWHEARLTGLGASDETIQAIAEFPDGAGLNSRLKALLAYTDRVTQEPGAAEEKHIAELKAAGFTPTAIVTIGQLIGFLGYQVRAIAVARAFAEAS